MFKEHQGLYHWFLKAIFKSVF